MIELSLGDVRFSISDERHAFALLRSRYASVGRRHKAEFLSAYRTLGGADELIEQLPRSMWQAVDETVPMIADDIAAYGIYNIDIETITNRLVERIEGVRKSVDEICDQYFEIIGKSAELDAERTEAREARGRLVGGGFGVEGAAKGIATAAALNAVVGIGYGIANLTAKAALALGDSQKKRALYHDEGVKTATSEFIGNVALQGHLVVAEAVNKARATPTFELVTEQARREALAIIENVESGRVPSDRLRAAIIQAIELDPFAEEPWRAWLNHFEDFDGSVGRAADKLDLEVVRAHKEYIYLRKHKDLVWHTPEDCEKNSAEMEEFANSLGLNFEDERKRIQQLGEELDRERRTVSGVLHDTLDEADASRDKLALQQEEIRSRTFLGSLYATVEDAEDARAKLQRASRESNTLGWLAMPFRRVFDYSGRSSRREVITFHIFLFCVLIIFSMIEDHISINYNLTIAPVIAVFSLCAVVPLISLYVRRLHDLNMIGFIVLLCFIPYVGPLGILLGMAIEGTSGDNKFGPDPVAR